MAVGPVAEDDYLADQIAEPIDTSSEDVHRAGRPEEISNDRLLSTRDQLFVLLTNNWVKLGSLLQKIRNTSKVVFSTVSRTIQKEWKTLGDGSCVIIDCLVRPSEIEHSITELRVIDDELFDLHSSIQDASQRERQYLEAVEHAEHALRSEPTGARSILVSNELASRKVKLAQTRADLVALRGRAKGLTELLLGGRANFARRELIEFCHERRYALTPLNTANALAGVPWIKWRRSMDRCRTLAGMPDLEDDVVGPYGAVETLRKIVESRPPQQSLLAHAKSWFEARKRTPSVAVVELADHWYYLEPSIEAVLNRQHSPRKRHFEIASEYYRRISTRSDFDRLLERDSRIICVKIKKRKKK
jgi:hypothetical protein